MPTYLVVSIVIVLLTAGGFVAARSGAADQLTTGAGDVEETPLPTPVPLETGTPLPTPVAAMPQGAIVDTAVTFWGPWLSEEVTDALNEIAAGRSGTAGSGSGGDAAAPPTETPMSTPTLAPVTPPPAVPLPAPTAVPLPPLPVPIPSVPLPTLPPLLP